MTRRRTFAISSWKRSRATLAGAEKRKGETLNNLLTVLIGAAALIAAAILNGGVYQIVAFRAGYNSPMGYRLNRLTGEVSLVAMGTIHPVDGR